MIRKYIIQSVTLSLDQIMRNYVILVDNAIIFFFSIQTTLMLEDLCEMMLETETELLKTEESMDEPSMVKKSNHEERSNGEKDIPDIVSKVPSDNSNVCFTPTTEHLLFAILNLLLEL